MLLFFTWISLFHLDIVATESCDDEVVVSTWFPRNAVAKLAGVVVVILPMVVMN